MGDSISGQFADAFDSAVLYDMRQEGVCATTTFLSGNPAMQWYHLCMSIEVNSISHSRRWCECILESNDTSK